MPCWCRRSDEKWPDCSKLKSTETQITACYFQDMQKSIPESITYWNLMQMGYRSRRPQWWLPCQLRTLNQGYSSDTTGKMLPGLLSLDFCCNTHMLVWEHFVNNMKAFQQDNVLSHKDQVFSNRFLELTEWVHSHQISVQLSTFGMWWNKRFTSLMWCYHVSRYQHLWGLFPTSRWIWATNNWSSCEGKKGSSVSGECK